MADDNDSPNLTVTLSSTALVVASGSVVNRADLPTTLKVVILDQLFLVELRLDAHASVTTKVEMNLNGNGVVIALRDTLDTDSCTEEPIPLRYSDGIGLGAFINLNWKRVGPNTVLHYTIFLDQVKR
jgi:hypothetical protein